MTDNKKWEALKSALFQAGRDAIEAFLDYEIPDDESKDATENRLDEAYSQMPDKELASFFRNYGIQ